MVPPAQPQPSGGSYTRRRQSSSGSGVSPHFHQEPLADTSQSCSAAANPDRLTRCGSLRRPAHPPPTKICLLDTGSGLNSSGRLQYTVVPLYPPLAQPSPEPHQPMSPEDSAGSPTSGNSRHSVLTQRDMVPSGTSLSSSPPSSTLHDSQHALPTAEELETLRLDTLRAKYNNPALTSTAQTTLMNRLSTSESRVSVRSVASSLALRAHISLDDIQTLGNWTNSAIFQQHYRREHLSQIDFTNTVLSLTAGPVQVSDDLTGSSDDDSFVDALSDLAAD